MTGATRRLSPLFCLLVAASGGGGCSFLFVSAPPANNEKLNYFDCTSSNALPVVDTVIGGVYGIATVAELSNRSSSQSTSDTVGSVAVPLLVAGLFAASAINGLGKTDECRNARVKLMARLDRLEPQNQGDPGAGSYPAPDPWLSPAPALAPLPSVPSTAPAQGPAAPEPSRSEPPSSPSQESRTW
jgi:hypothetical protein